MSDPDYPQLKAAARQLRTASRRLDEAANLTRFDRDKVSSLCREAITYIEAALVRFESLISNEVEK